MRQTRASHLRQSLPSPRRSPDQARAKRRHIAGTHAKELGDDAVTVAAASRTGAGKMSSTLSTGCSTASVIAAPMSATHAVVQMVRAPARGSRRNFGSLYTSSEGALEPPPHPGCTPQCLRDLCSGFGLFYKELYGCTDLRGRPAERGRGSRASQNQVTAGYTSLFTR